MKDHILFFLIWSLFFERNHWNFLKVNSLSWNFWRFFLFGRHSFVILMLFLIFICFSYFSNYWHLNFSQRYIFDKCLRSSLFWIGSLSFLRALAFWFCSFIFVRRNRWIVSSINSFQTNFNIYVCFWLIFNFLNKSSNSINFSSWFSFSFHFVFAL